MVRLIILIVLFSWGVFRVSSYIDDDKLRIIFCDVGQGDATIIRHGSIQMLIDGGKDDSVLECLQRYIPPWDNTIELVVATHPDADHINGLVSVLENYQVDTVLHNGQTKQTADFGRFKDAVKNERIHGAKVFHATNGVKLKASDEIDISVLYPLLEESNDDFSQLINSEALLSAVSEEKGQSDSNYNDNSVVLKVVYKKLKVLLMGDLEQDGEEALLREGLITDIEVLKVGHHGAKTSSTPEFIRLSRPEISVISAGKNNSYGHPHPLVLERLSQVKSLILRTDQEASIELVSDGYHLWKRRTIF